MGRFVFRLQKILDHRERIEDAKKQAFVKSRYEYLMEMRKLDELRGKMDELISCPDYGSNAFSYIARYNYMTLLEDRIKDQAKIADICREEMNQKKREFETSQKDRKVLDKLKEQAHNDYYFNLDKLEQKQNDEFALYGYVRK